MPKKGAKTKATGRKRPKIKPGYSRPALKILISLTLLVSIVLGAVLLANVLTDRPKEPVAANGRDSGRPPQQPLQASKKPTAKTPAKPVFEVFQPTPPPDLKPAAPAPPLPEQSLPLVAIIIDDIGYDRPIAEKFMDLDIPLTLAFLPHAPLSRTLLDRAQARGYEVMLHLPMEPEEYPAVNPGPGALLTAMSPDELIAQLEENLDRLKGIKGVNNHMGSRLSASSEHMRQIFSILKKRGLYYVDSRTGVQTAAPLSARLLQLPFAERDIFIDHLDDPAFIRSQMQKLIQRARKQGYAIGIAHPHQSTYHVLLELLPELKAQVTLVPASMVVQQSMFVQAAKSSTMRN
jgi:uncharacterized protein